MTAETPATHFEPAGRVPKDELVDQLSRFGSDLLMTNVADGSASFISILNLKRQVVYANRSLTEAFGISDDDAIGLRPGELMGCRNVSDGPDGCGTSRACATCGAAQALRRARLGTAGEEECRILREDGEPLDLRVTATPVSFNGEEYILFSAIDISDTKRRRSLERIFFHDIMNTATGVRGLSSMARMVMGDEKDEMLELLEVTSDHLIEEIQGQRELLAAESNELTVRSQPIRSGLMLRELASLYESHDVGQGKTIRIDEYSDDIEFVSDPTLVGRVLGNLIKNALEATRPGGAITVGCSSETRRVVLTVHNSGVMPANAQLQVFQRSFSTKGDGRGLGTYGSRLLTERYLGGEIGFESTESTGTTFRVSLPPALVTD